MEKEQKYEHEELMIRCITGIASDTDLHQHQNLMKDEGYRTHFVSLHKAYDLIGIGALTEKIDLEKEWNRQKAMRKSKTGRSVSFFQNLQKIAAVALIIAITGFSTYFIINFSPKQELASGKEPISLQLKDGSEVTINRYTKITYPKDFKGDIRKVNLQGEAFFKVKRDESKEFVIESGDVTIKVLGTSFNVKAYEQSELVEVSVATGKVSVASNVETTIILEKGEKAVYNKNTKELNKHIIIDPNYDSWKTRIFHFNNTILTEAIKTINNIYHTQIVFQSEDIKSCRITADFNNQSLESVLLVLEQTLDLKIIREGNKIFIKGKGC